MAGRKGQTRWYTYAEVLQPSFRLESGVTGEGEEYRDLYLQTFELDPAGEYRWRSVPESKWHHLARIFRTKVVTYPVFANPSAKRYLKPRHAPFKTVVCERYARDLPETADLAVSDVEMAHPWNAFNACTFGLGFTKDMEGLWHGLRSLQKLDTIVVAQDDTVRIEGKAVRIPEGDVDKIRRAFDRTTRRMRDIVKQAKATHIRNALLAPLDPSRFPPIVQVNPEGQLVEFRLDHGRQSKQAARDGRSATVKAVRTNVETLAAEAPKELIELHAEIERATLQQMIEKFEDMLKKDLPESAWQKFFERNAFILTMVFARPVRLLHTQFHAQSAGLDGRGALVGDFLFAEQGFGIAIVEIKKPASPLMGAQPYRNTKVFSPSAELTGGVMQVLHQRNKIRENWLPHSRDSELLKKSRPDAIKCVVVAGMLPKDDYRSQSFEVFRDASKDVEVITFDELLGKLKLLLEHLAPRQESLKEVPEEDLPF
ncbi:Shedu immune nuclease family protein [Pseudomonas aeruginosa]|uniref:Shedu immune nuclease family protein n=1 Tax=Pseudomonas aeruginosa TaxID=287 RepID=UPI00070DECE4|nr:Shedu immune nuclease family protein [Pseudomonas aeruginosa]